MKLVKANTAVFWLSIIFSISAAVIWYHHSQWITMLPYLNWIMAGCGLLFCLHPKSNLRLEKLNSIRCNNKPESKLLPYFNFQLRIILVQIALTISIYCIYTFCNSMFTPPHLAAAISFSQLNYHTLWQYALFPWPTIAVTSAIFGYYCYYKKQPASITDLAINRMPGTYSKNFSILFSLAARMATITAIASCISAPILMCAEWILQHYNSNLPHGISIFCFIFSLAIFFTIKNKSTLRFIKKYFKMNKGSLQIFILFAVVLLTILIVYSQLIPYLLGQDVVDKNVWYSASKWELYTKFLSYLWWVSWMAPLALWIAENSSGQKLRSIIIAPCLLPALVVAAIHCGLINIATLTPSAPLNHAIHFWQVLIGLLAMTVVLACFTGGKRLTMLYDGVYNPQQNKKYRHPAKALAMILFACAGGIFFSLQTGMRSMSFIYCVQFMPMAVIIYFSLLAWPVKLLIKKTITPELYSQKT